MQHSCNFLLLGRNRGVGKNGFKDTFVFGNSWLSLCADYLIFTKFPLFEMIEMQIETKGVNAKKKFPSEGRQRG